MAKNPEQLESSQPERLHSSQGFDEDTAKRGKELVNQFYILMKTAQIHDSGNVAVETHMENCFQTLKELWQWSDEIHLRLDGDYLYIGDLKLRMDIDAFVSFTSLIETFKQFQIGGFLFKKESSMEELRRFTYVLVQADSSVEDPFELIQEKMIKVGITHIQVDPYQEQTESFEEIIQDAKELAKSAYFRTMTAVAEVMDNMKLGQAVSVRRAKRVVQSLVDLLLEEESTLLGLTTLRSHDEYTHNHSVNVCILSMMVGQRLGYSKKKLTDLGIAGLFHDIGKAEISPEILNKPSDFTEEEWKIMRMHPILGVKFIIRLKGINELTIRMVTGAFEHHMNYDLSGYPRMDADWEVTLLGRIIGLVDCYDALTSSRVYNRVPYSPEKALKFMLSKSGRAFDPILMKLFVNSIGIFPIGTMLLLDNNEFGVVVQANPNPDRADRPKIKIIADSTGKEVDGDVVDLAETIEKTGKFKLNIVKVVDSTKHHLDVSRYFL